MNVDLADVLCTIEVWLKELEGSGEIAKGVALLVAKQLVEREIEKGVR